MAGTTMTETSDDMPDTIANSDAQVPDLKGQPGAPVATVRSAPQTAGFGSPRDFLDNRFIYLTISARARGLSIGVNMNPDKQCNFDCVYCEVDRRPPIPAPALDVNAMSEELQRTLSFVHSGQIRRQPNYTALPDELLQLRHVALSGDGEPTLCPNFAEAVQTAIHVRARGTFPYFKIVLITNATALDLPQVQQSLNLFARQDEVWVKLEAGSQGHYQKVNRPTVPLAKVMENILFLARRRPVVIQSLFPLLDSSEPGEEEIELFSQRLCELKSSGAMISLVQIYSATRPTAHVECSHLPLKSLFRIAKSVRKHTGLTVEVF